MKYPISLRNKFLLHLWSAVMLRTLRQLTLTLCAAACVGAPSTSFAAGLFGWRDDACCDPCGNGVTTYRYRPLFPLFPRIGLFGGRTTECCSPCATSCYSPCATSCCSPCAPSVQYVPQTTYRPYVVNVPVTTCQCVQACDPCTGCPVTVRRPVTTYVQQVRYAPCTTYRPVCPTPCCSPPTSCASPCGVTESYVPSTTTVVPGYAPSTTVIPGVPGTAVPSTPSPLPTFREGSNSSFRPAVPFNGTSPGTDRTTSVPQRSWTFRHVSSDAEPKILPAKQVTESRDSDDAWRAAKR